MRSKIIAAALLGSVISTAAAPQTPPAQQPAAPPPASSAAPSAGAPMTSTPSAEGRSDRATPIVAMTALENGANSFTEGQARSRIEDAGFTEVQGLTKDDNGIWRGRGMRNGASVDVALDFRGRIAAGSSPVMPGAAPASTPPAPAATAPAAPSTTR